MMTAQLDALLAVAKYGSMNKAADSLFITQPALKKRLDSLEAELGITLLQRSSTGSCLTESGKVICEEIAPLYQQMKKIIQKEQAKGSKLHLRVSQVPFLTLRHTDERMSEFHRYNKNIAIERVFMTNDHWFDALRNNEIDVCNAPGNEDALRSWRSDGLCCLSEGPSHLICLLPSGHSLSDAKSLTLEDLIPYSVYAETVMLQYSGLSEAASACGLHLKTSPIVYNRYDMMDASNEGNIFLHDVGLGPDLHPLVQIPIAGFSYTHYTILRNNKEPALRAFYDFLQDIKAAKQ